MGYGISRRSSAPRPLLEPKPKVARHESAALEHQRLVAILEGSEDAIISETSEGIVSSWNPGATRIFGYTAAEMIGRPVSGIIPPYLEGEEAEMLAKLARGERIDPYDTVRLAKDGRQVAVSVTVFPLRDAAGTIVGASEIARDLSNRKASEELRRANEALRRANEAAQRSRAEAEEANRAKTEFLAVMSHEIRTPLTSIHGFIDLLTHSTPLTPEQRRYADLVKTASAALLTIVNEVLEFSKVEAGRLDLELHRFSLWTLIHDSVAILAPAANAKNLKLDCAIEQGVPEWVMGDHDRLRQILLNLLNNAVKFTQEGSIKVDARSQITADGREQIYFSVTDTGIGVPLEHHHRLFRQFSQADSSVNRKYGGTGLGLAICKRLVELMDGEIGIHTEVGQGSTFWFTARLPGASAAVLESEPASRMAHEKVGDQKSRILVVDDVATNLEIVKAYLRDEAYHVDCVSSGLDAIQLLGSTHYDLILMDVQMPIMDGVTATKRIRALSSPIGAIPIIAMTGNVLPQQVKSFLDAGMNDHIGKPIERVKLYNNMRRWLPRTKSGEAVAVPFEVATFDAFVSIVGMDKTKQLADKFLLRLSGAFKSTFEETQREAHGLINMAGVLGLGDLVRACRMVLEFDASQDPDRGRMALDELQRAQLTACQMIKTQMLPKLPKLRSAIRVVTRDASCGRA